MKAAALHDDGDALERAAHELTPVPGRPGLGEARNLAVGDAHGALDRIRDPSQPRAEHDRDARLELPESPRHDVGRLLDRTAPCSLLPAPHSNIPASVADRKFASVPAIIARNPSRARSCLRSGASAPMPPICMPTELTFANPHRAKVAMVKDRGSRWVLRSARSDRKSTRLNSSHSQI